MAGMVKLLSLKEEPTICVACPHMSKYWRTVCHLHFGGDKHGEALLGASRLALFRVLPGLRPQAPGRSLRAFRGTLTVSASLDFFNPLAPDNWWNRS